MKTLARDGLTAEQVRALLTAPAVTITGGLQLLDTSNRLVEDISGDLVGGSVSWDNRDPVHGSVRLSIMRSLAWGRDRVRPYLDMDDGTRSARFYLGVYVLTAPDTNRGEEPITYGVTGYDLLALLQTGPADTWVATAGTTYFAALQAIVDASGIGARLLLDGASQATAIPATRVWALTAPQTSWLRMMIDLLAEIGYVPPWVDESGNIRSRPFQDVAVRPVEWTLDTSDERTNLVGEDRTLSVEAGDVANSWRFARSNMDTTPVEGDGIYTPAANQSSGPTSIDALGRTVWKFQRLDAADQAALVAQGDRIRAGDMASVRTISLQVDPLPVMEQDDVFWFVDAGESEKVAAKSWTINLDGSPGDLQLGGAPPPPLDAVEQQAKATVTSAAPLRVVVDGASSDSFANALDAKSYSVGQRVTVTVRNPQPPLVAGVES